MSHSSSRSSRSSTRRVVHGVPRRCWCGENITTYVSKTEKNPYRRFYRCEVAMQKKSEEHVFKWVDEVMLDEIKIVDTKHNRDVKELRKSMSESFMAVNAVVSKLEDEMKAKEKEKVKSEQVMKVGVVVFVVGAIVLLSISLPNSIATNPKIVSLNLGIFVNYNGLMG